MNSAQHSLRRNPKKSHCQTTMPSMVGAMCVVSILAACSESEPEKNVLPAITQTETSTPVASQPLPQKPAEVSTGDVFWASLTSLCNHRYQGQLTIGTEETDREFGYADLSMHAIKCHKDKIDIDFIVDQDRSRTWMIERTDTGFSLHHRHLKDNGKEDDTSGYGGYTTAEGTAIRQEFPADEQTGQKIPEAAANIWAIEIEPNNMFAYELQREADQRMFRVVFDLATPVE